MTPQLKVTKLQPTAKIKPVTFNGTVGYAIDINGQIYGIGATKYLSWRCALATCNSLTLKNK